MPDLADINRAGFSLPQVGSWYSRQQNGFDHYPEERAAFDWLLQQHGPVTDLLDLGVGAGRTTETLRRSITQNYVGVDFSPTMIDLCRKQFPNTDFRVGDARDLSMFGNGVFDLVFFSFNGIDYVDHAGRLAVLSEVRRVLRPNGFFVFSSHNRNLEPESIWRDRPVWFLLHLPWMVAGLIRHQRMRRFEVKTNEYEIRNDTGSGYRMLTYYIDPVQQIEQLTRAGFYDIDIFDTTGRHLEQPRSPWLCYFSRRGS